MFVGYTPIFLGSIFVPQPLPLGYFLCVITSGSVSGNLGHLQPINMVLLTTMPLDKLVSRVAISITINKKHYTRWQAMHGEDMGHGMFNSQLDYSS